MHFWLSPMLLLPFSRWCFLLFFFFFCLKERKKLFANSFLDHLILLRLYFYNSVTNFTYFWRANWKMIFCAFFSIMRKREFILDMLQLTHDFSQNIECYIDWHFLAGFCTYYLQNGHDGWNRSDKSHTHFAWRC